MPERIIPGRTLGARPQFAAYRSQGRTSPAVSPCALRQVLAIGERAEGPIFLAAGSRRLDRPSRPGRRRCGSLPSTDTSTSRDLLERVGHAPQSVFVDDGVHKVIYRNPTATTSASAAPRSSDRRVPDGGQGMYRCDRRSRSLILGLLGCNALGQFGQDGSRPTRWPIAGWRSPLCIRGSTPPPAQAACTSSPRWPSSRES